MYALRERRQHVTQEDFEFAVAKVSLWVAFYYQWIFDSAFLVTLTGLEEKPRGKHFGQQAFLVDRISYIPLVSLSNHLFLHLLIAFCVTAYAWTCISIWISNYRTQHPPL